jgi:hypothetical protein
MKYWIPFFCAIVLMLASCIPDPLEVKNIPELKPKIVVSTQFVPDQSLVVMLTKSFSALQNTNDEDAAALIAQVAVTDATVIIRGTDSMDTLINLGNGLYGGIAIPFQPEGLYQMDINSETLGEVHAITRVSRQIDFDSLVTKLAFNGYDDTLLQVSYKITDPVGKDNYLFNIQRFRSNDLLQNIINPRAFMKLVDDQTFEGREHQETFRAFPRNFKKGDTVAISLANISSDYFQFLKMREDNRFNFVEFLGEPINYPSNVEGGLGYFNLFVPTVRVFILE